LQTMDAKNKKERKSAITSFSLLFFFTLLLFLLLGITTLTTAKKGISMLEEKKVRYDEIFRKQADYNFRIDNLLRNINSLKNKDRTNNEHKQLQQIITQERVRMEDEIEMMDADSVYFSLYKAMLRQIQATQEVSDQLYKESRQREYYLEQLQKGRRKLY
jgi:hypothetical protein